MKIVTLARAKATLSALLDQVEKGVSVAISRRHRVVAEVRPVRPPRADRPRPAGLAKGQFVVPADFDAARGGRCACLRGPVKLLLDTAPFLWYILADDRLPGVARDLIRDPEHDVWLSVVSLWEVVIKGGTGRLSLPDPARTYVPLMRACHGVSSLPLEESAVAHLSKLPALHRDPFDRMLVCQAIEHDLVLVTADEQICRYP